MENINTLKANLSAIGDAIRGKLAVENKYRIEDMPAAINSISGGRVEPCIITATRLLAGSSGTAIRNDWDKIKNLIDYERAYRLLSMFASREDLTIREVEEFLSHRMPNVVNLSSLASFATFIDSDISTHVFDLTLDSPNCTDYADLFDRNSNIRHVKLTITEHNADFSISSAFIECNLLNDLEIKGPGLSHATALKNMCQSCTNLKTATIGDDNTNYSKIKSTENIFKNCSNLKILTIKGVNVLPLSSAASIPSSITHIKVPAALEYAYKHSTNWANFAENKISAI